MQKLDFNRPPDPHGQIHTQLSNVDRFLLAQSAAKSKNPPDWETLPGLRYLSGFTGSPYSSIGRSVRKGKIPGYKIGGTYYFLISEVVRAINEDPSIACYNWLSYEDDQHSEDELIIHWRKYKYPDHILIKFTYLRWTSFVTLPANYWRRNARIAKVMIREVNKRHKNVPFKISPL